MKRRMIERFLSSFLVLCLLMSLMPIRAGATNFNFVGNATSNKIYNVLTELNSPPSTYSNYVIAKGDAIATGYYNQSSNLVQVYLGASPDSSSSHYVSRSGDTTYQVLNTQQSAAFAALFDGCGGTLAYNTAGVQYSCIGGAFVNVGVHLYTSKEFTLTSAVVTYASDIYAVGTQATKSMVSSAVGTYTNGSDTITATLDISGSEWTVAAYHANGSTDSTFTTPSDLLKLSYSGAGILTNGPNMGYTITFTKSPSSSGATTTQTKYSGTSINVPAGDGGTWLGHTFKGWTLSSGSATVNYAPSAAFDTDASTTLYAVWEWTTYPVTYDANLGTGAPGSQIKTYGVSLALSSVLPNREGYAFIGWNTDVNGMGTAYNFGATYTGNADLNLYAQWRAETYTIVTYNANGGTGAPGSQTANYASTITLSATQPTQSGYSFVGWAADAAAKSAAYAPGGSYTAWGSETLHAVWQSSVTDAVSYNANGGSGVPSSQNKTPGVDLTLSATAPTKTGHAFKGWSTAVNGSIAYNASGIYTAEASIVLYAVWEADTYAVTYNDNIAGELVTVPDAQTKTYGAALTLSNTVPSREGYAFTGWDTSADGTGTDYAPGASHAGNAALNLFAQWTANTYAVNYDANGGTFSGGGSTAGVTKTYGISLILSPTAPTRTGYAFKGWSTAADGALAYGVGATYAVEASISLFAVWEANTFAVTYSDNITGEIVTVPDVQSKSYDTTLVLSNTVPVRDGYTFCTWNSSADGEGTNYAPGVNYAVNAALTLYAQWDAKTYDIDYNANGGTYSGSSQDKFHGTALTLNAALATRSGYNFVGWAVDAAAGSASYAAGGSYSTNASVTLYAVWQSETDVVSYNANGGINPPSSQNKTPNVDLTLSATVPTKTGYAFKGWSTAVNGAVAYGAGDIYTAEASVVLYAVWDGNPYAVTYNDNTAVEIITVPDVQTKIHATTLVLSSTVPIREGYTFSHWNSSANGGGTDYAPGASYAGNAALNLYAQWVTKTFAVSYNANGGTYTGGNQTKTYGAPLTLNAALATRSGYNFVGWAADAAAESASYAAGGSYSTDASITLYAVWQSVTDVVSYNANGGINPPSSQNKTPNVDLTLSATAPTMTGYAFKGWSTAVNGAVAYGASDIYTAEASVVLYAVWEANTFAVTYSDNIPGEIVTVPDGQTKNYGTTLVLSNTVPTRQGYAFTTWYTTANGAEGTAYEPGASYAANATLNLFAQWSANTYAVSYNANGGTFSGGSAMASAIKTFDVSLTLIGGEGIPARIGYAFAGWSLQASAVTAEYAGGASYTDNGIVTLYAVWVVDKYTTSTSLSVSPSSEVYVGDAITLTATATRTGAPTNFPAAGTTITFYSGNVVLGTSFVGANGIATYNTSAVLGTTTYKAIFNGSGEDKASVNETNTVSLTVKSVTIQLAANTLTVKHGADTITGTLTAGTTYVLTAPAVYATDAEGTALAVTTQYAVEWWWYNGSSWCKVNSDSGTPKQLTITPSANGQKWYAKILPAGKYTLPASGLSTEQVTCGDMVDTVTTLITSPTAAYEGAENAVTLKASVIYATSSPVTDGWVMFEDEDGVQVGYAKLDNQGHADVKITLPAYSNGSTAYYYAVYEGTAYYDSSDSEASMTSVTVKSTTYEIPTVTVKAGSTTIGSTTTSAGVTGLTAGVTYVVSADITSLKGIDGFSVTAGDYTLSWEKESGGATETIGIGSTYAFIAEKGEAYRLHVTAKNNMKYDATSKTVSVDNLATPVVTLDTSYSFLGASATSTSDVVSNRINGSHVGDEITLTATVTGTNNVPAGTVDFFYIPSVGSAVKLKRVLLTDNDTNQAQATFTVNANLLPAGMYTFHAVYNGSTIFSATTSAVMAYRVWSVTIASASVTAVPAASGGSLLTAGTSYAFSMGDIHTTDGENLVLGTDYTISWYVSTNGSPTGYGTAANISTSAGDNTWTQTPADSNYRYKAVIVPLTGSESATYPAIGVTSNLFSTSTAATQTSVSANTYTIYEGNDITLTATVSPTGDSVPTGTVKFYYYTTDANSKTELVTDTSYIQSRTSGGVTVYYAQLTTDDLPDNDGAAQNVYVYAEYMGNNACGTSDGVTSAVRVKSSVVASTTVLIITANGTFADVGNSISFMSGSLPADGSKSILTLGTITTKDGITEPLNENDFIITWEKSTNFSGIAAEATWVTCKTGEFVSEVTPATYSTAYRVKITPKFDRKTKMSGSSYYSNIITAGSAASVTQMSIRSSGTPAADGSNLSFDIKIFGGSAAPTGSVTFYQNGSSISTCNLANGTASFRRADMAVGTYVFKAVYTSTNGYAASIDEQTYYVRYAPAIALTTQTATYDGKAHYLDSGNVAVSGMSDALNASAPASVSCYFKDAAGNVTTPVDVGTYTAYAHLQETTQYAGADATGTLVIAPRTLAVTDFIIQAKTYDGTTSVNIMTVDTDALEGDSVLVGGTAVLDSAAAGTRAVTFTPAITGGDDAGNYKLADSYTVVDNAVMVARNLLSGAITSDGLITVYKADGSRMLVGTGAAQYKVTYYHHDGNNVKAATDLTKDGKYTIVVQPNDKANYKGGLSTTMTVTGGVKAYDPVTCSIPVSFAIGNTMQIWNGDVKTVTVTPSISGFTGYTVVYVNADTSKVGIYGVTVTVTGAGYSGSAVGRMQVLLGVQTNKATISVADKVFDGAAISPVITNTPSTNYYVAYTGGSIQGVSYTMPRDAGTYVATLFVESTDSVTAYSASDSFTISRKTINLAADDKTKEHYATNPVWTFSTTGLVSGDSSLDFIKQPDMTTLDPNNDYFDQVGTYTIEISGAYSRNYNFTYTSGAFKVSEDDPNVPMTIIGFPEGDMRYGDSIRLYTYGTKGVMASNGTTVGYSDSSVISYTVVSGHASIAGDILTITGTGQIVLKVMRGEGQNTVYSTVTFTALTKTVTFAPTFGTNTYDGTTGYNATGAVVNGAVSGGQAIAFGNLTKVTADKINAGSYVMTVSVSNAYYSGTGVGLMVISPKAATITAASNTTTYGTALAVGATAAGMDASPAGYKKTVASSDVGSYETFAAGLHYNKNYHVAYVTGTQAITAKSFTITAGSRTGTEYGVSTTADITAASFANTGERVYGAGNQVMDYTAATFIAGDSLADINVGGDGIIVSYDKVKTSDANRTSLNHSTAIAGRSADYAITLGTLDAVNYTLTKNNGKQNIYQRDVTVTAKSGAVVTKPYDGTAATTVPTSKYQINNLANNDVIGLTYTAAFSSATRFDQVVDQADNAVTLTLAGLYGDKILNYHLQTASFTMAGRILPVTTEEPTAIGTVTATLNGTLLYATNTTEVGFYIGESGWTTGQMIKVTKDGVTNSFSQLLDSAFTKLALAAGKEYKYYSYAAYYSEASGSKEYTGETVIFSTKSIGGRLMVNVTTGVSDKSVLISIQEGNYVLGTASVTALSNGSISSAEFTGIKDGVFNVVASSGNWTETSSITITNGVSIILAFVVPANTSAGSTNSRVTIESGGVNAAVDGLDSQFDNGDRTEVAGGSSVSIDLTVGASSFTTVDGYVAGKIDIGISKTTTTSGGDITQVPLTTLAQIIEIAIPLTPKQILDRMPIIIYREHGGGAATAMTKLSARQVSPYASEGYYVDYSSGYVFIYSNEFSSFYIAEAPVVVSAPVSGGGGGVPLPAFEITVAPGEGGSIDPQTSTVTSGASITFTIIPDDGNVIADVLVDGVSIGAVSTYAFDGVNAAHTISAVFASGWVNPFVDVHKSDWFYNAVEFVARRGLMNGTSANTFEPGSPTTRAMIVTMLYRLEGKPSVTKASGFSDVAAGTWYTDAVAWAAANGIVKGYDADTFGPEDNMTREQMVSVLNRYALYKGYDVDSIPNLSSFTDVADISGYALKGMEWAVAKELIIGTDDNKLDPTGDVTRAQSATLFMRFVVKIAR